MFLQVNYQKHIFLTLNEKKHNAKIKVSYQITCNNLCDLRFLHRNFAEESLKFSKIRQNVALILKFEFECPG